MEWLVGALAVMWLGLGAYVALLAVRQQRIARRLSFLEKDHE